MERVSIYRRFRPDIFDKVIGQKFIVKTLINQIVSGQTSHAYLFTGTRGTGKTSCAKIFARAVNCLNPQNGSPCGKCEVCRALADGTSLDVIEIDAASNNGVDEIRELKENAQYRPTLGKYKVYIVDEVHMLSMPAFNALLKTLEEPPEHIIFILATTEVQKLPQTILSRCMRFDFRLVAFDELVALLKRIFDELGVEYDVEALGQMALRGEGSVRDTLSIADMCMSYCGKKITLEETLDVLCATNFDALDDLAGAILEGRTGDALTISDKLLRGGRNGLSKDLANHFMNIVAVKNVKDYVPDGITAEERIKLLKRSEGVSNFRITRAMEIMAGLENQVRFSTQPRILLEAAIVKACEVNTELNTDALVGRIKDLEEQLSKIKQNGIVIKSETNDINVARVTNIQNNTQPNNVDDSIIESVAVVSDEALLFEETEEADDKSYLANEVWGKVINRLTELNEDTLYMVANGVDGGLAIINKAFIINTDDKATIAFLNKENNRKIIEKLIKECLGDEYEFICRTVPKGQENLSAEKRVTLEKLFNGSIKFKK